ncbi:hypothetical protein QAD02_014578 [Eretmocerus hayati]|uniref:Uncharacterized protein n=1 Tax=Eretmocerus hayati TaxID=131215 RepID=A0ACC2P7E5_9HYME|nr:hypothetical protein QAD02_014578 [Eretmocerus hayati]
MARTIILVLALMSTLCQEIITSEKSLSNEDGFAPDISTMEPRTTLKTLDSEYEDDDTTYDLAESRYARSDGGADISIKYYPYVAALYDYDGEYMCVGTVLTARLLLTADHCVYPNATYSVRINSSDIYDRGDKYWVKSTIRYPKASVDGDVEPHDIAMIVLKKRIQNARTVKLIEPHMKVPEKSIVRAVGWGRSRAGNPRILQHVNLEVTPVYKCQEDYYGDTWICTESKRSDTCQGDSGGPILYKYKNSLYQVGVVSHSTEVRCATGQPSANSFVKRYLEWINSYTKNPKYQ